MGRGACTFRVRDIARALKAARGAGLEVCGFTVDKDGKITVNIGKPMESVRTGNEPTEWDEKYGTGSIPPRQ